MKVCGLTRRDDADLAVDLGAAALGFVFEPSSPRFLDESPPWLTKLPPYVTRVAVFGPFGGSVGPGFQAVQAVEFRSEPPTGWRLGAIRLNGSESVEEVVRQHPEADALVLDAHRSGSFGGTGLTVDWGFAAEVVAACDRAVILAGGLTPANVAEAVVRVKPYAVDVSSGIELEPGVKSSELMRAFFAAIR